MGKKAKTGKSRRDKFYHLAKETGYRARSAFKLLQLNRKYEFLQKSRVCVDLCAAPGGWLQVAAQHMPVSSLIVGIDLMPIRPIPGVTSLVEDITTAKCRQKLKAELQTWQADVFLNDGAPNVGKSWIHDAFQQAELTLAALKLATEFLKKGGWFVTKVFRSKDYTALMWVFGQLFKKVFATKPQASRHESAEIFVVCQYYIKPDKLDPKFLDPKYVFKDVMMDGPKKAVSLMNPKEKKKAEGYTDGDYTLHHKLKASEFITADNHMELLADAHQVILDDDFIANHELTTLEIKQCMEDIKVLGKKELRSVLTWRRKMKKIMDDRQKESQPAKAEVIEEEEEDKDSEEEVDEKIAKVKEEEMKEEKKKRKKVMKEKRKLRDKMALKMIIPGDSMDVSEDLELFKLKEIKNRQQLKEVEKDDLPEVSSDDDSEDELIKKNRVAYERYAAEEEADEMFSEDDDSELDMDEYKGAESGDEEDEQEEDTQNPLMVDLESKDAKTQRKMDMWFNKSAFSGLEGEEDEDLEIEKMTEDYRQKGGVVLGKTANEKKRKRKDAEKDSGHESDNVSDSENSDSSDSDSESSDGDSDYDIHRVMKKTQQVSKRERTANNAAKSKDGFEIVAAEEPAKKIAKLDAVGLAIGEELIKSKKRRRELEEESFNRYTFNDDGLPDWFVRDESRHMKKPMPVSKEQIDSYKERMKAINARPIKKIAEAKARKKRKGMKKLEKARKQAEAVTEAVDVSEKEKWQQIKQIYKKAGLLKNQKPEVAYVVAKKGVGRKVSRPAGVKGRFKVVDPRMKKDMRNMKGREKKGQKGKRKGKK